MLTNFCRRSHRYPTGILAAAGTTASSSGCTAKSSHAQKQLKTHRFRRFHGLCEKEYRRKLLNFSLETTIPHSHYWPIDREFPPKDLNLDDCAHIPSMGQSSATDEVAHPSPLTVCVFMARATGSEARCGETLTIAQK